MYCAWALFALRSPELRKESRAASSRPVWSQVVGLRVGDDEEEQGLDLVLHDEQGYNL